MNVVDQGRTGARLHRQARKHCAATHLQLHSSLGSRQKLASSFVRLYGRAGKRWDQGEQRDAWSAQYWETTGVRVSTCCKIEIRKITSAQLYDVRLTISSAENKMSIPSMGAVIPAQNNSSCNAQLNREWTWKYKTRTLEYLEEFRSQHFHLL